MSTTVDTEEMTTTRSEQMLAVVLAVFLLIGTIWVYVQLDPWIAGDQNYDYELTTEQLAVQDEHASLEMRVESITDERDTASVRVDALTSRLQAASAAGSPTAGLEDELSQAQAEHEALGAQLEEVRAEAAEKGREVDAIYASLDEGPADDHQLLVGVLRLGWIALWLGGSYVLLSRIRERRPRYLPLPLAAVGTGAVLALVFAVDYITDWVDPFDLGPIVLALLGGVATVAAFVWLQRYLARRLPGRRVRKGECPFCGYPVRDGAHCEGCGREVVADCSSCGEDRRVGSMHCVACGV